LCEEMSEKMALISRREERSLELLDKVVSTVVDVVKPSEQTAGKGAALVKVAPEASVDMARRIAKDGRRFGDSPVEQGRTSSVGRSCLMQEGSDDEEDECQSTGFEPVLEDSTPDGVFTRRVGVEPAVTLEKIRAEQLKDEEISFLLEKKEAGGDRPSKEEMSGLSSRAKKHYGMWDMLAVKEGVLAKRWETEDGRQIKWLVVLPRTLREQVLDELHASRSAGHLGRNKMKPKVVERYYWAGMDADIRAYLHRCVGCAQKKNPQRKHRAPLRQHRVGAPMERIAIDVLGPLPETHRGNKYVLVVGDYWTKWMEAYAIEDQQAETVATKLVDEFVCRFGTPLELHSDQGRNFESDVFQEMCRLLKITKTRTTAYHPCSDGMVERYNRTIVNSVSLMLQPFERQKDWDEYLPYVNMAYRSSVQESTGETPNMMMLGRDVRLPVDLVVGGVPDEGECDTLYADELREKIRAVHERARVVLGSSMRRQKRNYDRHAHGPLYKVGQFVWLHNTTRQPRLSKKLMLPWVGPFMVVEAMSDVTFRIQRSSRSKPTVVHANRLKLYEGPELAQWKYAAPEVEDLGLVQAAVPEEVDRVADGDVVGDEASGDMAGDNDVVEEQAAGGADEEEEKGDDADAAAVGEAERSGDGVDGEAELSEAAGATSGRRTKSKLNPNAPSWTADDREGGTAEPARKIRSEGGSGEITGGAGESSAEEIVQQEEEEKGPVEEDGGRSRRANRRKPARYLEEC
jgi:hypothetical protein